MRQKLSMKLAGPALAATALIGSCFFTATPASASVAASTISTTSTVAKAGVSGTVGILANSCNYPTSARPGSTYVESFSNCNVCRAAELLQQNNFWWRDYYCTYNPSNNLNDLHYK